MSKQRKRRKSLNAGTPSTPKSKYHVDDNMFATPKSHHIQDDDSDSSPYSLSFSQRAIGVEVTWGEKSRPTPFKSKKIYERRDTESPPTKSYFDVEPVATDSPKGLYKFLLGWERRRIDTQIEDDFERISNETAGVETSNYTNASTNNDTNCLTYNDRVEAPASNRNNSLNFKQLLNDSEDMDLMLCSQRIEQEIGSRSEPSKPALEPTASKGFSEFYSDNDDDLLLALEDPVLLDKKHKSSFARHKSIAIQPNSSINEVAPPSKLNSNNSAKTIQPQAQHNQPSTPKSTATATASLVRHKSMPSPNVTTSAKKCSAQEIEIKRQTALAKLKLRKQRLTKK
ncbi:hypothetical protein HA402_010681 [Bradysia odoriphaga]|nr:hypothetical protein HA402_010681 [Bradysia odoriphaga]